MADELSPEAELAIRKFLEEYEGRQDQRRHQRTMRIAGITATIAALGVATTLAAAYAGLEGIARSIVIEQARQEIARLVDTKYFDEVNKRTEEALNDTKEAIKLSASLRGQIDTITDLRDEASKIIGEARDIVVAAKAEGDAAAIAASDAKQQAESAAAEANALRGKAGEAAKEANRLVVEAQATKQALASSAQIVEELQRSGQAIANAALKSPEFQALVAGKLTPPGIIVASTVVCSALGTGWIDYADGAGRFIIGAGFGTDANGERRSFRLEEKAGTYRHRLTIDEMPQHTHGIVRSGDLNNDGYIAGRGTVPHGNTQSFPQTTPTGGNQPHSIMPPYIALFWCKKER